MDSPAAEEMPRPRCTHLCHPHLLGGRLLETLLRWPMPSQRLSEKTQNRRTISHNIVWETVVSNYLFNNIFHHLITNTAINGTKFNNKCLYYFCGHIKQAGVVSGRYHIEIVSGSYGIGIISGLYRIKMVLYPYHIRASYWSRILYRCRIILYCIRIASYRDRIITGLGHVSYQGEMRVSYLGISV